VGRGRIFINYRRDDAEREAVHLATFLGAGPFSRQVFIDKSGLRHKPDWLSELERQVNASDAMVAVIGPGWSGACDAAGQRRLDDPNDFVRFELARAFALRRCPCGRRPSATMRPPLQGGSSPRSQHGARAACRPGPWRSRCSRSVSAR
jgi:hypothetical protein